MKNYLLWLSKIALSQYKRHEVKKEWRLFILFVFLAKVLTWSISIYAGQNYFSNLLYSVLNSPILTKLTAIVVLIIIEVLTTIALSKFFKFLLRGFTYISTVIALFFVVAGLFSISFISSTNGLAMRQSQKVDKSEIITERAGIKKQVVKDEIEAKKYDIDGK